MLSLAHTYILTTQTMYIGILFIILFTVVYYRIFHERKSNRLPTNWPILGMIPSLLVNIGRIHQFVTDVLEQNEGTFVFTGPWLTNMELLITSEPANIHYILTKNFPNFPKGPDFKKMFEVLGDGIFVAESESWENQRRTAKSLINLASFQEYVASTTWKNMVTGLFPILDLASQTGTEVDLQDLFKRFAFDCTCIEVLGHDPGSLCHELPHLPYEKAFADAEEAILYRHITPEFTWKLQNWLHIGKDWKMSKAKEVVHRFLAYCIALKRENFDKAKYDLDILTCYMRAVAEKGEAASNVPEEVWRDAMLNLMFAGKDTISAALTWFFWLLATNPSEEEKIRQEILRVNDESGKWEFSNMEELKKLVYLHGALCEALRLFPPIPFQHKAPLERVTLPSGHVLKPNMKTVLSFYSVGRRESVWGEDCLEFKPGRWISEAGRVRVEPSFKFTAFNAGPRSCLGKEMSFIQMKIVAAAIVGRFRARLVEGHPIAPSNSVVLHMRHGLKVKVSKLMSH